MAAVIGMLVIDHFWIETQIDAGGFNRLFAIEDQGAGSTHPRVDTNLNGVGDGTPITATFTRFSRVLANPSGSVLDVRATFNGLTVTHEDLAFDSFRIEAIPEPNSFVLVGGALLCVVIRRRRLNVND